MSNWTSVLEMNAKREVTAGSEAALCRAIRNAADFRIYTAFRYNEHLYPCSPRTSRDRFSI